MTIENYSEVDSDLFQPNLYNMYEFVDNLLHNSFQIVGGLIKSLGLLDAFLAL